MWRRSCNRTKAFATGLLQSGGAGVYNSSAMMKKAILTVLTVMWAATWALAQEVTPQDVSDKFTGPGKPTEASTWISIAIATVFLAATVAVAFKDPRRTHLDEQK